MADQPRPVIVTLPDGVEGSWYSDLLTPTHSMGEHFQDVIERLREHLGEPKPIDQFAFEMPSKSPFLK